MARFSPLFFGSMVIAASGACSFSTDAAKSGTTIPIIPTADAGFNADVMLVEGGGGGGDIRGDACGSNFVMANHLPPDLLIVLDRSGSMLQDPATGRNCPNVPAGTICPTSKWAQMTAAINQVVGQTQGTINWGLLMFGSGGGGSCMVPTVAEVAPATMSAAAIMAAITAGSPPATSTPTRAAENSAAAYLRTLTDANPKVILLATDGQPNCPAMGNNNNGDDPGAIAAVTTAFAAGIPTYVIGVATMADAMADATLSSMAMEGGHPRAATPLYYPVTTTADLTTALTMIQSMVNLPCKYSLNGMVQDKSMVSVMIGGQPAPDGSFSLDPGNRAITFTGATCDMLTAGNVTNVMINIGCQILIK